jgi:hypothetical protein
VYLEAFNSSVVRYLMADHQDAPNTTDSWLVTISAYLSAKKGETIVGKLLYKLQTDVSLIQEVVDVNHTSDNGDDVRVDFSVEIAKVGWTRSVSRDNYFSADSSKKLVAKWLRGAKTLQFISGVS